MSAILFAGALLAILILYSKVVHGWIQRRKHLIELGEKLPGPPALPLVGNAHLIPDLGAGILSFLETSMNELAAKGEGVVRVWIGLKLSVFVFDGKTLKDILDSNEAITKGDNYDYLEHDGEKWRSHRKWITPSFHFTLENYLAIFNEECRVCANYLPRDLKALLDHLEKFSDHDDIDIFPYIKRCALDIICQAAMGTNVNAQQNPNHPYVLAVRDISVLSFQKIMNAKYSFPLTWTLSGNAAKTKKLLTTLHGFTNNVVRERKANRRNPTITKKETKRRAFIDMLLDLQDEGKLTDEEVREEVDTFTFAGHDTTSTAVGWTLWCLATHPEIQERVLDELDQVFGDSDRDVSADDFGQLKYLEMCVKETMRVRATVPLVSRYTADADFQTQIFSWLYENPHKFNPDNFLPENVAKRHPYDFVPFSAGARNCIGQKFAMNEARTMIAWVLRRFRLSSSLAFDDIGYTAEVRLHLNLRISPKVVTTPNNGFPVRLNRRIYAA